ncbi:MAG: acyl carrier protein [Hyphomicrobium sp.]|jgi:acyl carrier protein
MTHQEIKTDLIRILTSEKFKELEIDPADIHDDTSLLNEVMVDSLQLLDFIAEIEHVFGFKATAKYLNLDVFDRFADVIDFVHRSMKDAQVATLVGDQGGD